jgi:lysophospholipase L1-like esterase
VITKNFDSSTDAPTAVSASSADLEIGDDSGNVLVRFYDGHVKTKYFDSKNFTNPKILKGKKVVFLGDSITYGYNADPSTSRFSTKFCNIMSCTEVNLGVAGTCIAANTTNGMGSQRFITRATSANLSSCDMVIVWGGTNDFSYDSKAIGNHFVIQTITSGDYIGTQKKVPPSDTDTFSGALHELILQIRNVAPTAQLVFIQPLNRGRYNATRPISSECNIRGDYLQDFRDAISDICKFYSIPVVPMDEMLNQDWQFDVSGSLSSYDSDGIHPNTLGHARIANLLAKWMENNIII